MISAHCVSVYIIYSKGNENEYLLLRRCGSFLNNTWQMVSGKVEKNEKAWEAAFREVFEETGICPKSLYVADVVETFYMKSLDKVDFVPVFVVYVDEKYPIKLAPKEHDSYEWVSYDKAKDLLVFPEQKRVISHVHNNFVLNKPNPINLIENPIKDLSLNS